MIVFHALTPEVCTYHLMAKVMPVLEDSRFGVSQPEIVENSSQVVEFFSVHNARKQEFSHPVWKFPHDVGSCNRKSVRHVHCSKRMWHVDHEPDYLAEEFPSEPVAANCQRATCAWMGVFNKW
jgi:hypothetical protein